MKDIKILATDDQVRDAIQQLVIDTAEKTKLAVLKKIESDLPVLITDVYDRIKSMSEGKPVQLVSRRKLMEDWKIKHNATFDNWEKQGLLKPYKVGSIVLYNLYEIELEEKNLSKFKGVK
jgi:hypothetical protein